MTERLDFDEINRVALGRAQELLTRWLPGGRVERGEYVALNPLRVDRKLGSFRINISNGRWADFAVPDARGGDLISLHAYLRHGGDRVAAARALSEQLGINKPSGKGNAAFDPASAKAGPVSIGPVPGDAPPCAWRHPKHGRPSALWHYYTSDGTLHHIRARIDYLDADGEPVKEVLPVSWCLLPDGSRAWASKEPKGPLPLYNLVDLLEREGAPVLVTEGEKAADAAAQKLPGYLVTTSAGGCKATHKTDWTPLAGRRVTVWPDADDPGAEYAKAVAEHCSAAGAASVAIVTLPAGLPEGWDLADEVPAGINLDVAALIAAARPREAEAAASIFRAVPFIWRDPATLPRREFIYGRHLIRKYGSATIATSGLGKSALALVDALAMVTGRNLIGQDPPARLRVLYVNLEDPLDELLRRVAAICTHYGIQASDIGDRLFLNSGRDSPLCIAEHGRDGVQILPPVVDAVVGEIRGNRLDAMLIDPFVATHRVPENDNGAIDRVAKQWTAIADQTNSAIELYHHTRKPSPGGGEATVDDSRGASALIGAVRSARVLNRMTADEGAKANVKDHLWFFRIDNGKRNLVPPLSAATWCKFENVELPNGDHVGVVTPWTWPDAFTGVTPAMAREVQKRISEGEDHRQSPQSELWAGSVVADVLGLDVEDEAARARIKLMLAKWIETGALKVVTKPDKSRRPRKVIEVGTWVG